MSAGPGLFGLYELLHECIVRVLVSDGTSEDWGTGFFVAPGCVLTCAHVVAPDGRSWEHIRILTDKGYSAEVTLVPQWLFGSDYPDLAILSLDCDAHPVFRGHAIAPLDASYDPQDKFYTWGYGESDTRQPGASVMLDGDGWARTEKETLRPGIYLQMTGGPVVPGLSGAPLLNLRTRMVCGVLKRTRDYLTDAGGWGIPASEASQLFPELLGTATRPSEKWLSYLPVQRTPRAIPPLLAYECDRQSQREILASELRAHAKDRGHRPFVCFVHGHADECLQPFVEHARRYILPACLDSGELHPPNVLQWPPATDAPRNSIEDRVKARLARIRASLASEFVRNADAPDSEIVAALVRRLWSTMVLVRLFARNWQQEEPLLIQSWLRSLAALPDLPPQRGLYVFVAIEYESSSASAPASARKAMRQITRFLSSDEMERDVRARISRAYRAVFGGEEPPALAAIGRTLQGKLSLVALPELPAVRVEDAKYWVGKHASDYCAEADQLDAELTEMYRARQRIPMQELQAKFHAWLRACSALPHSTG